MEKNTYVHNPLEACKNTTCDACLRYPYPDACYDTGKRDIYTSKK